MDVVEATYRLTSTFPKHETYGIASQLQRAAVSIPSNIAEGHSRDHLKEFIRFVSIARGSVAELETQVELARRIDYAPEPAASDILAKLDNLGRQLNSLRTSLQSKLREDSSIYDDDLSKAVS
jgi:four helix bundle protein